MHSGADVEAFQAALNRDIEGDASNSQPPDSNAVLSQGSNRASSQSLAQWPTMGQEGNTYFQNQQAVQKAQQQQLRSSEMEQKQQGALLMGSLQQLNDALSQVNHLPPQQKQPQDHHQLVAEQVPSQVPQMTGIETTERSSIPRELERANNQDSESHYAKLQKMSNQQASGTEQPNNQVNRGKQVPFAVLLPSLLPQLGKDRAMQLHTLYGKLKKNEIAKDGFVGHMRDTEMNSSQVPLQSQVAVQSNTPRMPSVVGATQFGGPHSLAQLHQKGPNSPTNSSHPPPPAVLMQTNSCYISIENKVQKSQEMDRQSDSRFGVLGSQNPSSSSTSVNQERDRASIPGQGINMQQQQQQRQQQQHLNFTQTSFAMYGSSNYYTYTGSNVSNSGSCLKPQPHDSQIRQIAHNQSSGSNPVGGPTQAMNMMSGPKLEKQNSTNDPNRLQGGSMSHFSGSSVSWQPSSSKELNPGTLSSVTYVKQESVDQGAGEQHGPYFSAAPGSSTSIIEEGNAVTATPKDEFLEKQSSRIGFSTPTSVVPPNLVSPSIPTQMDSNVPLRAPQKKTCVGQKKLLEALGSSPPLSSSRKAKVSGGFSDQSIEQLNDVTAVSGVNLREEEEQLFSGPRDESRVSEASRRIVQEEEERVILQKIPLQKKLAEIMAKSGLKNISNDVERCLSLCMEERMHGLLCNLIRLSKQVDVEKPGHRTIITSDVRQQIMMMNQNSREEWEKKQAETEKLRKLNDPDAETTVDGDKEKMMVEYYSGVIFPSILNKEEDDKMRSTAANVAARAAVGGDDMLSKWQLMAEQARQKREGGTDSAAGKDVNRRSLSASGKHTRDNQESEKRGPTQSSWSSRKSGRNQGVSTCVARAISVKDVIAVLEREPQMSKSTLIYRLYDKTRSEAAAE
ncbi:hypothetical protein F3Y22_tig00111393pilonHSYRG00089 [Hibiscus syriacus]|uniref:RST domain-containing protein n=1 Tax=Hibiscus syriacus TaxID=106335 RepID=A0A6A2XWD9_HIBSY|nr:hypothetical protein F3Y22_tig00111393pilonHSYRG00089 [Hibiscus syriacus]